MNFPDALSELRAGHLIRRSGWNGKNMFLFMRPVYSSKPSDLVGLSSIPSAVIDYYVNKFQPTEDRLEPLIFFAGTVCLKAADDFIVNGWLASQTDLLAEDWEIAYDIE